MLEAGYRCAVPTCRTVEPLDIHHIVDYAKVKTHEFDNMIVLCANCHRRVGKGPRRLDRKSLRIIKRNLGLMYGRYSDVERRVLQHFVDDPEATYVLLPETPVLFGHLVRDGLIEGASGEEVPDAVHFTVASSTESFFLTRGYRLTADGSAVVRKLRDNIEAF